MSIISEAQKITDGIEIIELARRRQDNPGTPFHFRALHDEIVCGSLEWITDNVLLKKLTDLGWYPNEDYDGFVYRV